MDDHLILTERLYPGDGRKPRWEMGAGSKFSIGPLTVNPNVGWVSDGFVCTSLVVSAEVDGHTAVYIGDRKWRDTGDGKPGFLYQKAFFSLDKYFWVRWEGVWLDNGKWLNSQPGLELRVPVGRRFTIFVAGQYDHVARQPVVHTGIRF